MNDSTRAAARNVGVEGVNAYQKGDYATAHDKLERAYLLVKAPSLGLWSARALQKVGKLVEAGERYLEVTRLPISGGDAAIQIKAQTDARTELDALTPQIPSILVKVEGADPATVSVTLDGAALSSVLIGEKQPVNPGQHRVLGTLGAQHVEAAVTVAAAENGQAVLRFQPVAQGAGTTMPGPADRAADASNAAKPSATRTIGWVGVGVGGAGIVFGGITGMLALSKHNKLNTDDNCRQGTRCLASETGTVNSYNSLRTLSSIGFIAGGVIGATGLVLLLSSHPHESTPGLALLVGPGSAALGGQF